jgi:hypothetical protein
MTRLSDTAGACLTFGLLSIATCRAAGQAVLVVRYC